MLSAGGGREKGPRNRDLGPNSRRLDFTRRFLPESLARTEPLAGLLSPVERLTLNHIRGRTYVCLTGRLEELHLESAVLESSASGAADEGRLFARLREDFDRGFGSPCGAAARLTEAAGSALFRHPLSQALAVWHLAGTAERHHREAIRDDHDLDACFRSLLVHRFERTAGHARLRTNGDSPLRPSPDEVGPALDEFLEGLAAFERDLEGQVGADLESLERAIVRELSETERDLFRAVQGPANRWTYLGAGLTEPGFLATVAGLGAEARDRVLAAAASRC